jgi:hypothetical protein
LPEGATWEIVDGNLPGIDMLATIAAHVDQQARTSDPVRAIAVMPAAADQRRAALQGDQGVSSGAAISAASIRRRCWPYVDWLMRGQGEQIFLELLEAIAGERDPKAIADLAFREPDGTHWIAPERVWRGPNELPAPPYHKIDVPQYLQSTFLGRRSGVYQASVGCPYGCNFLRRGLGVRAAREGAAPARTAEHLGLRGADRCAGGHARDAGGVDRARMGRLDDS